MTQPIDRAADRLRRHLLRSPLLTPHSHLLVAVSGGLDSMVLLHVLRFHCNARWTITAAHYDHAMRPGSDADAEWLRGVCAAWGVPFISRRAARPPRAEAEARAQRYDFLSHARTHARASVILTAHHADDQAETVLLRLARGTGLTGLRGIAPRRGDIVRPLLRVGRDALEAYAAAARLGWREDPTNTDVRYARNRVRHRVIPQLEAAHAGAARRIARLAALAAAAESAWADVTVRALEDACIESPDDGVFVLARDRTLAYHPHIRARVLRELVQRLGGHADRTGTRRALEFIRSGTSGTHIELTGGVRIEREFDTVLVQRSASTVEASEVPLRIPGPVAGAGRFCAAGRWYSVRWAPAATDMPAAVRSAQFDADRLQFPLELRAWRAGDRIRLPYGSKKLKKLFQERRVGRAERSITPVLADALGEVLWVAGVAQADGSAASGLSVFQVSVVDGDSL